MTLRAKVTLAFLSLALLFISLTVYSTYSVHTLHDLNRTLTEVDFKALDLEKQLWGIFDDLHELDLKYLALRQPDYLYGAPGGRGIKSLQQDFRQKLAELNLYLKGREENELLNRVRDLYSQYASTILEPEALEAIPKQRIDLLEGEKVAMWSQMNGLFEELFALSDRAIKAKVKLSAEASKRLEKLFAFFSISSLAIAALLSGWMIRRILMPLRELQEGTHQIANGNFAHKIHVSGKDELAELAQAFNAMAERLAEIDRVTKEFIFKASHDLKAPIAVIMEANDLLLEGFGGQLSDKQRQLLNIGQKSCARLQSLINALLDLARMEAGAMEYHMEERDLVQVVLASVQELEPLAHARKLTLSTELLEPEIRAVFDHMRIAQVMQNLLSNALKFTPEGGSITVRVWKAEKAAELIPSRLGAQLKRICENGYAVVSITDTGVGIPTEELDNIFRTFYQVRRTNVASDELGTGLGLAIAKSIIEAHSGLIWAESRNGQGSRFCFLLPLAGKPQAEAASR